MKTILFFFLAAVLSGNLAAQCLNSGPIVSDVSCGASSDGQIEIQFPAGCSYSITWSDGQTTNPAVNLQAGTYAVTVSYGPNTPDDIYQNIVVNNPTPSVNSYSVTDVICPGSASGAVSVNASHPSGVSYLWSTGATTSTISGLSPGAYFVTITSGDGCSISKSYVVSEDPLLSNNWQKNTHNQAGADDVIKRVIFDNDKNIYAMGVFTNSSIVEGKLLEAHGSANQKGIFVIKYSSCGDPAWIMHTFNSGNQDFDIDGFDLDYDASNDKVVLFGKWDYDGTNALGLATANGNQFTWTPASTTQDVFTIDINASSGSFAANDVREYNIDFNDICTSGKSDNPNNAKYIGGSIQNKARVGLFPNGPSPTWLIDDANSGNLIADFAINGSDLFAVANLSGPADFGNGTIGATGDAAILKANANNPVPATAATANGTNVRMNDIEINLPQASLVVVGGYRGSVSGWAPAGTSPASTVYTGLILKFDMNLLPLALFQLEAPGLVSAEAMAVSEDQDMFVVVGTLRNNDYTKIQGYLPNNQGSVASIDEYSGPGTSSLWVAKFSSGAMYSVEWGAGSSSSEDTFPLDVVFDVNNIQFFTGGHYRDDIDLPPVDILPHPAPPQQLGFLIRGGEAYSSQGSYYKTGPNDISGIAPSDGFSPVLFPNPGNGIFTVSLQQDENTPVRYRLFDISGKQLLMRNTSTDSGQLLIDLSGFSPGSYLLSVETPDNIVKFKLMIR